MLEFLFIFLGSVAIGILGSLLGTGGGIFMVPFLTLVFGIPMHQAIATSLVSIIATSNTSASLYVLKKLADIRLGITLELATVLGAISGGFIAAKVQADILAILFAIVLLYTAFSMLKRQAGDQNSQSSYKPQKYPLGFLISYIAGGLSGLLGIGGGVIKVAAMYLIMQVPLKVAVATSNFMIGVTASAGCFLYYFRGEVNLPRTGMAVTGVFLGATLGSYLMFSVKSEFLRKLFVLLLIFLALNMFFKGIHFKLF